MRKNSCKTHLTIIQINRLKTAKHRDSWKYSVALLKRKESKEVFCLYFVVVFRNSQSMALLTASERDVAQIKKLVYHSSAMSVHPLEKWTEHIDCSSSSSMNESQLLLVSTQSFKQCTHEFYCTICDSKRFLQEDSFSLIRMRQVTLSLHFGMNMFCCRSRFR